MVAMDNDIPIRGRAIAPGYRGAWGHAPSLHADSAIIHGQHNMMRRASWRRRRCGGILGGADGEVEGNLGRKTIAAGTTWQEIIA